MHQYKKEKSSQWKEIQTDCQWFLEVLRDAISGYCWAGEANNKQTDWLITNWYSLKITTSDY